MMSRALHLSLIILLLSCQFPQPEKIFISYKELETRRLNEILSSSTLGQDSILPYYELSLHSILENYQDQNFESSVSLAEIHYSTFGPNDTVDLYHALSLIELSKYDEAQTLLEKLCANSQFKFQAEACWYSALLLLRDKSKWQEALARLEKTELLDKKWYQPKVKNIKALIKLYSFYN